MIGACDNCDRRNVPVSSGQFCGCDTTQCFICQGETDPDPYGEIDIECTVCHGDRRIEVLTGYDPRDGQPTGYDYQCAACNGTGAEWVATQPIVLSDLDQMGA